MSEAEALILDRLQAHFDQQDAAAQIAVEGDGHHFQVRVVSGCFEGLRPLKRQQLIYAALGDAITSGAVHAVELQLLTPPEWDKAKVFHS